MIAISYCHSFCGTPTGLETATRRDAVTSSNEQECIEQSVLCTRSATEVQGDGIGIRMPNRAVSHPAKPSMAARPIGSSYRKPRLTNLGTAFMVDEIPSASGVCCRKRCARLTLIPCSTIFTLYTYGRMMALQRALHGSTCCEATSARLARLAGPAGAIASADGYTESLCVVCTSALALVPRTPMAACASAV
jgi:hypothetical protein